MFPRLNCGFECNFSFYWQKWAVLIRLCFLVGLNWSFCSVFLQEATTNTSEDIEEASASQQTDVPTQEVSEAESPEGEEATAGEVQYCFIFIYSLIRVQNLWLLLLCIPEVPAYFDISTTITKYLNNSVKLRTKSVKTWLVMSGAERPLLTSCRCPSWLNPPPLTWQLWKPVTS